MNSNWQADTFSFCTNHFFCLDNILLHRMRRDEKMLDEPIVEFLQKAYPDITPLSNPAIEIPAQNGS